MNKDKPVTGQDLQELKVKMKINTLDGLMLMGTSVQTWATKGEGATKPLSVPHSILLRHLWEHPEDWPVTKYPTYGEMVDILTPWFEKVTGEELAVVRMGQLFGTTNSVGTLWARGDIPSPAVQRLFLVLMRAIQKRGVRGLKDYLTALETEAKARGLNSIDELWRKGWAGLTRQKTEKPKAKKED